MFRQQCVPALWRVLGMLTEAIALNNDNESHDNEKIKKVKVVISHHCTWKYRLTKVLSDLKKTDWIQDELERLYEYF